MINKFIFLGRLTKDPELRFTPNNKAVCTLTVALNRDKVVEGFPSADYASLVAWGKRGENIDKYLKKGSLCAGEAKLNTRTFKDKDSNKTVYVTEFIVEKIKFLDNKNTAQKTEQEATPEKEPFATTNNVVVDGDDLPF